MRTRYIRSINGNHKR